MALLEFKNIGIKGIAGAVPKTVINNYEYTEYFPAEDVKDIVDKTGIYERRFADDATCASDLCYHAAEKLISDLDIDKSEIDLVVFVSQTGDYRMPATSIILQDRLGLNKNTIAFDVNLGCSGFVYGLSIVYNFVQQAGVRKALLLDGETRSRVYSAKDRKTAFLFGDGGIAAIIEKGEQYGQSWFSLNSDGGRSSLIKMDAGGYRNPSTPETLKEKVVDEHGNIRSDEHGYMNGADVFNFVLAEVPKDIKKTFAFAEKTTADPDFFVFHQANKYMNDYLQKKLKLESEKVPASVSKFGNTSSVSIPLTIVSELQGKLNGSKELFLCGFGVGMSWASAIIKTNDCYISDLVEV